MKRLKEQIAHVQKLLNERKQSLLEFLDDKFYLIRNQKTSKADKGNRYWKYARAGFTLGLLESNKTDGFLIPRKGYSDKDFIAYVYNSKLKKDIENLEVVEALTYFLCGYDHFKTCEKAAKKSKPKIPVNNYYDVAKENLSVETEDENGYITEKELYKKRLFVKDVLKKHEVPKLKGF